MNFLKTTTTFLAIFLLMAFSKTTVEPEFISIEELANQNVVHVLVQSKGGASGNCIELDIKNNTADTVRLLLEPGRRLVSIDSSIQDIFIVKQQQVLLAGYESKSILGYGFCCQSDHGGPKLGKKYTLGFMAPPKWVELAEFIDQNNFPVEGIAHAVWAISNNHQTASIRASDMEKVQTLRKFVSKLKNEPLPWYSLSYQKDTSVVFTNKPQHLSGSFDYELTTNTVLTIHITDEKGKLKKVLTNEMPKQKGKYELLLNQTVKGWNKGKYYVRIYEGNHSLNKKMAFEL